MFHVNKNPVACVIILVMRRLLFVTDWFFVVLPFWIKIASFFYRRQGLTDIASRFIFEWPKLINIDYFYLTNQMTASLSWNSFVTEDNKQLCNTVASSWLFITSVTKELHLQESEIFINFINILVEKIMQGHLKMTSLRSPSDPHDDWRRGAGFNQTVVLHPVH